MALASRSGLSRKRPCRARKLSETILTGFFIDRSATRKLRDHYEVLANLGNPTVRKGITDMVSNFITQFGMTWYRQDFNFPPESYWKSADAPDRIGMTEIGHIEGLYRMWDDLLARHPGLHIDNCASGGRRLDIEMMSRSFVFWRTDHGFDDTLAEQAQTQALAYWVPENEGFETYTSSTPWTKPGPYSTPKSLYLMRLGYSNGYGVNSRSRRRKQRRVGRLDQAGNRRVSRGAAVLLWGLLSAAAL